MKRVALFAVLLGIATLVAPGLAQTTGLASDAAEELDPVGSGQAHLECHPQVSNDCACYVGEPPYEPGEFPFHCHGSLAPGSGGG